MALLSRSTKVLRCIYTCVFYLILPLILLRLLKKSRKQNRYAKRWCERFGSTPFISKSQSIWLHTVSVGETLAALPLINALLVHYPHVNIHVTTTTPTGSEQVIAHLGDRVTHSYLPYDLPYFLNRFFMRVSPILVILMETEIWPNLIWLCHKKQISLLLANGRLSEQSCKNYVRARTFFRDFMNFFSAIAAQSEEDARQYQRLGVKPELIHITGNLKFDRITPKDIPLKANQLRAQWGLHKRPVLIAGSTRDHEEPIILNAFHLVKQKHPNACLILVPRHALRAPAITTTCEQQGFSVTYRSHLNDTSPAIHHDIILGDTMGELLLLYALADITFVGGSLVNTGGQNMLEPASLKKPIITGPYLRNFAAISNALLQAQGQLIVQDAQTLAKTVNMLIENPKQAETIGKNAFEVYQSHSGATEKHLEIIDTLVTPFVTTHSYYCNNL